jgi:ABC-type nitrate/sulfonate/bicarbonate transport system, permease component
MKKSLGILNILVGLFLPALLLGTWYIASRKTLVISSPEKVLETMKASLANGFLLQNLLISFRRVIKGFFIGASSGFILGTWMGLSKTAEKMVAPFFHAIRNVPVVGWIPLFIIWFGFGEISQVVFIAVGAFYPVVLNTFQGIKGVRLEFIEVGQVFAFNQLRLFYKIILPASLPTLFTGIRYSLSVSWMLVVASELFGVSTGGIGNMMSDAREFFHMDVVIMGILTIGVIGFVMNQILAVIEEYLLQWKRTAFKG